MLKLCSHLFYGFQHVIVRRHHICVIGSGPAGFYVTQQLLKGDPDVHVDILEKLPVPYGLVRFGVAPDHPEVKNVINSFETSAKNPRCNFLGNVTFGRDVNLKDMLEAYHVVILAYGADDDKKLGIPGEDLSGVYSARAFVGWYNGLPENTMLNPNLSGDTAVIIGQGNVAVDVARILLTSVENLQKTDISQSALDILRKSTIRKAYIVGRRGPLQAAFTTKELREMLHLNGCTPIIRKSDFSNVKDILSDLPRPRKRLTELMLNSASSANSFTNISKSWELRFFLSPSEIMSDRGRVKGVKFHITELQGTGDSAKAVITNLTEEIPCQMVLRSIGYKSIPVDSSIPFNNHLGVIQSNMGRVDGLSGVYCTGWVRRGPTGVILTTMNDGFAVGKLVIQDMKNGLIDIKESKPGKQHILQILQNKGVKPVSFEDWMKIDAEEIRKGALSNKPREKITSIDELLQIAHS